MSVIGAVCQDASGRCGTFASARSYGSSKEYAYRKVEEEVKADRDAIQRIALEWPSYGRPRITAELRRQDWTVNPKLVYRLMREDNLLCVRKRKFVVTTDSNHAQDPSELGARLYPDCTRSAVESRYYLHPAA